MRANRRVSGAEIRFRQALWAEGARGFRRGELLPGRPDVIFSRVHLAVFVHGCYWHRCPMCNLRMPRANREYWRAKFEANVARDQAAQRDLTASGWEVATVWEHELRLDVRGTARRLAAVVDAMRAAT
jgi:DNA mismatch endonuclease (patch repair protein)